MAYVLYRRDGDKKRDILISICGFCGCLNLGAAFDWEPMGTVDPFDNPEVGLWNSETEGQWPGHYCANCCQTVRENDARALSRALFKALDMIAGKQLTPDEWEELKRICSYVTDELFLAKVREVADFAAEGAFQIC